MMERSDRLKLMAAELMASHYNHSPMDAVHDAFEIDKLVDQRIKEENLGPARG
jgi:hypothetical protein